MDVSRPVQAVTPTLDGSILVALAGTTAPLTLTEMVQLLQSGSKSGVRSSALRLVSQGSVLAVPGGYLLNRDHLAAPAVLVLAGMRSELLRRIGEFTDQWEVAPLLLGTFGSFARRDGDADSDIDLLLVAKAKNSDEQAGNLAERVRAWTGNECHVMVLTPADITRMQRAKEGILKEWDQDLVMVRGSIGVLGRLS